MKTKFRLHKIEGGKTYNSDWTLNSLFNEFVTWNTFVYKPWFTLIECDDWEAIYINENNITFVWFVDSPMHFNASY